MMAVRIEPLAEHAGQNAIDDDATVGLNETKVRLQNVSERLDESQARLKSVTQDSWVYRSQLEECRSEIARMSDLIAVLQDKIAELDRRNQVLLEIGKVFLKEKKWWWHLMPLEWQRKKRNDELNMRNIFNVGAYVERYPDVVISGQDPFRHFIYHGIAENREFD